MHGLFALLLPLLGGWVGLASSVIQFDAQVVKNGPAIVQGIKEIEQLKHCKCVMQVQQQAHPRKWSPKQPYGPVRMVR